MTQSQPPITRTTHTLPFDKLSPRDFERLCLWLVEREGYERAEHLGAAGSEQGRDIAAWSEGAPWVFQCKRVRSFGPKDALTEVEKVLALPEAELPVGLVFLVTCDVSANTRKKVRARCAEEMECHFWAGTELDEKVKRHPDIMEEFFHQAVTPSPPRPIPFQGREQELATLDPLAYARHMLTAFAEWQERYTPLFAEYREFELYAITTSPSIGPQEIPVLQVPEVAPVVTLLGESGAGKTTALWKLTVDLSSRLTEGEPTRLPVMVSLRNWSQSCNLRQLVQDQFSCVSATSDAIEEEIVNGNCLILVDGLNELPYTYDQKDAARRDLQNFLYRYPENRYVFTCRTPDYDPEFLQLQPDHTPPSFEIQRLDRKQVKDYVHRYFKDDQPSAADLLLKLDLENDQRWSEQSSFVRLARIPLYLQMIIWEYRRIGRIPSNKAKMLNAFISQIVQRDKARQAARISIDGKKRILGSLAFRSTKVGYYLSLPENLAKTFVSDAFQVLRSEGAIPTNISFDDVWQEILSNNFLTMCGDASQQETQKPLPTVEWLHQLIFDFFLGCEIVRVLVIPGTDEASTMRSSMSDFTRIWDQPCQIALGLLDVDQGAKLSEILFQISNDLAKRAVKGQGEEDAANLAQAIVERLTGVDDWDASLLTRVALALPYTTAVNSLIRTFRWSPEHERQSIAEIMSSIVIKHYGSAGAKRAEDILESWIANRNEIVRFYSAKGLWERDRGRAAAVLRALYDHGSPEARSLVSSLAHQWGIS